MKKTIVLSGVLVLMTLASFETAVAQDAKVMGVTRKVLVDNDQVKVYEIEFAPGATDDWHSHPQHVVYAMTPIKIEVTEEGKAPVVREMKAGDASFNAPTKHKVTNIGREKGKALVTELKDAHKH